MLEAGEPHCGVIVMLFWRGQSNDGVGKLLGDGARMKAGSVLDSTSLCWRSWIPCAGRVCPRPEELSLSDPLSLPVSVRFGLELQSSGGAGKLLGDGERM